MEDSGPGLGVLCLGHLIPVAGADRSDPPTPTIGMMCAAKADTSMKEMMQGMKTPVGQMNFTPEELMTQLWGKLYKANEPLTVDEITKLPIRPPPGLVLSSTPAGPAYVIQAVESIPAPPLVPQEFVRAKPQPASQVSWGSTGHPTSCADACQYLRRKGGCRDGSECPKCHLCFWQRKSRLSNDQSSTDTTSIALTFSIGTQGHPHHCGNACKYVRRKTGCLNGESCPQCHLCQWRRDFCKESDVASIQEASNDVPFLLAAPSSAPDVRSSGLVAGGDLLGQETKLKLRLSSNSNDAARIASFSQAAEITPIQPLGGWNKFVYQPPQLAGKMLSIFV